MEVGVIKEGTMRKIKRRTSRGKGSTETQTPSTEVIRQ
jgi:hypothetical protein